jgi:zinc and cadmium transporter
VDSGTVLSFVATAIGIAGSVVGVYSLGTAPRKLIPLSGALLAAIAIFAVYPELAESRGWVGGTALLAGGVALLWAFGRFVYPVCPSCSHTHDHERCPRALHGFAAPLIVAASLHAFLDGLGISASQQQRPGGLATAVVIGVTLHKIPEGIALGVMLRAAVRLRAAALAGCIAAELVTAVGALLEAAVTARFGVSWVSYALALAGGSFLYLGFHALHGEWRRRVAVASARAEG